GRAAGPRRCRRPPGAHPVRYRRAGHRDRPAAGGDRAAPTGRQARAGPRERGHHARGPALARRPGWAGPLHPGVRLPRDEPLEEGRDHRLGQALDRGAGPRTTRARGRRRGPGHNPLTTTPRPRRRKDTMELEDLLEALDAGERIEGNSPLHEVMHRTSQEALRVTGELNTGYHEPARIRELLSELTGTEVDASVTLFPPLHSDFG